METKNDYYVYVYLNQTKKGRWSYKDISFEYQPFYIGKGRNKRDIHHLMNYSLKMKTLKNSIIKSIINKTGEQPIHYRLFEGLTNEQAIEIEIEMIKHFGRKDNNSGLLANGTDGGDGANNFSDETLKKIGQPKKKIYQYNLDGVFIKEWEGISHIDVIPNPDNIATSIKRNGTAGGYIWSYEFKEKLETKIKYQMPIKYENIEQVDKETGEVIKCFKNALEIEKELNLRTKARNTITACLKGELKTAYGFKWQLKE